MTAFEPIEPDAYQEAAYHTLNQGLLYKIDQCLRGVWTWRRRGVGTEFPFGGSATLTPAVKICAMPDEPMVMPLLFHLSPGDTEVIVSIRGKVETAAVTIRAYVRTPERLNDYIDPADALDVVAWGTGTETTESLVVDVSNLARGWVAILLEFSSAYDTAVVLDGYKGNGEELTLSEFHPHYCKVRGGGSVTLVEDEHPTYALQIAQYDPTVDILADVVADPDAYTMSQTPFGGHPFQIIKTNVARNGEDETLYCFFWPPAADHVPSVHLGPTTVLNTVVFKKPLGTLEIYAVNLYVSDTEDRAAKGSAFDVSAFPSLFTIGMRLWELAKDNFRVLSRQHAIGPCTNRFIANGESSWTDRIGSIVRFGDITSPYGGNWKQAAGAQVPFDDQDAYVQYADPEAATASVHSARCYYEAVALCLLSMAEGEDTAFTARIRLRTSGGTDTTSDADDPAGFVASTAGAGGYYQFVNAPYFRSVYRRRNIGYLLMFQDAEGFSLEDPGQANRVAGKQDPTTHTLRGLYPRSIWAQLPWIFVHEALRSAGTDEDEVTLEVRDEDMNDWGISHNWIACIFTATWGLISRQIADPDVAGTPL
jgi:hypothetical protein